NGDGVRDAQDRLSPDGPTTLDVWLVSDHDRDGTPVVCDYETGTSLTVNSYSFVLHAVGGTMQWGVMQNRFPFVAAPVCVASDEDTTNAVYYHNGWAGRDILPPGRYHLATLTVTPASGTPSVFIEPYHPVLRTRITAFGTKCPAMDFDNTYKLGIDFADVAGLGPPQADPGGPYYARTEEPIGLSGGASRDPEDASMTYHWDFGDGATGDGVSASHVYAAAGRYTATLTVTNESGSTARSAEVVVTDLHQPIARSGGPYEGRADTPVHFDGRGSSDPDDDPLAFAWTFGDGYASTGPEADHAYPVAGTYTATLTVSDGSLTDSDAAAVTILEAVTRPPVADPGGPYAGITGRNILFDGTRSYDPEGEPLGYTWTFGDGGKGYSASTGHTYDVAGVYDVTLTVADRWNSGSATTTATIASGVSARAFTDGHGPPTIYVGTDEAPFTLSLEPLDGAFSVDDVDLDSITMRSEGTGSVSEIPAQGLVLTDQDADGNGVRELTVTFAAADLADLFAGITHPTHATVTLSGRFYRGGVFFADLAMNVRPGLAGLLTITPNPFNPQALVRFHLTRPGPVRANLFDVRGRMVRTVLRGEPMQAGTHQLVLDATGDHGSGLASGIYFLRLAGPDGVLTRRLAVTK
ncbi:MAG: PKD domain-containing protein, partial [Hyphomicrobiales bacterium]